MMALVIRRVDHPCMRSGGHTMFLMTVCRANLIALVRMAAMLVAMAWLADNCHARQAASVPPTEQPPALRSTSIGLGGHGWLTWRDPSDRVTTLLHLPPRTLPPIRSATGEVSRPNTDGSARLAPGFTPQVDHLAWCGDRVFALLREDRTGAAPEVDWKRRILGVSALRTQRGASDVWEYPPGRPELINTLPARSLEVVAFGATRLGPAALLRHAQRSTWVVPTDGAEPTRAGSLELLVHIAGAWRRVALPAELLVTATATTRGDGHWLWGQDSNDPAAADPAEAPGMSPPRDRLTLFSLDQAAGRLRASTVGLPTALKGDELHLKPVWRTVDYPWRDGTGGSLVAPSRVCVVDGVVIAVCEQQTECQLLAWPQAAFGVDSPPVVPAARLPVITGLSTRRAVVPMDGSGRVAIVWQPEVAGSPSAAGSSNGQAAAASSDRRRPLTGLEIREISVTTGKVLFEGTLKSGQWFGSREYQVLAVLLVLIMAAVVVFVLRPDNQAQAHLPVGVMLAEPSRRLMAVLIDYLPAALLVELMYGLPTGTLFLPSQFLTEQFSLGGLATALAMAATQATVGECLFGRSLGKLLTGAAVASIRVAAADPVGREPGGPAQAVTRENVALGRPAAWQCIVRNAIKWGLPVVGIFVLFDARRRHPGDLLAKTIVLLTEIETPPPPQR